MCVFGHTEFCPLISCCTLLAARRAIFWGHAHALRVARGLLSLHSRAALAARWRNSGGARIFFCLCCSCCTARWGFGTRGRAALLRARAALVAYSCCSRCALARSRILTLRCSCCTASAGALGLRRALALLSLCASSAPTSRPLNCARRQLAPLYPRISHFEKYVQPLSLSPLSLPLSIYILRASNLARPV